MKSLSFYILDEQANDTIVSFVEVPAIKGGFPSPATDYLVNPISLDDLLFYNKASTFIAKVEGDSMMKDQLPDGSLILIDRSITPKNNHIVVAEINGEFTVKRLQIKDQNNIDLIPHTDLPDMPTIKVTSNDDFKIIGVVTWSIIKHY